MRPFGISLPKTLLAALVMAMSGSTAQAQFTIEPAFPNLSFSSPVDLQEPGDGTNRLFVVERSGIIRLFDNDPAASTASVFLDIQARVSCCNERGLLGLVFDPDFATNGFFYVYYTAPSPLRSVISRFELLPGNPDAGDPNSELILLEVGQPNSNHNGGQIAFGPDDGYLYIALGDGGGSGDPGEHGQNPQTLLGSILRIDVEDAGGSAQGEGGAVLAPDCGAGPNANYLVPDDNPLADGAGGDCDEIWAYGLRNPWRFSFDPPTGELWAGDVGQGEYEEVDLIEGGKNYGWNTMEGFNCFDPPTGCNQTGLELPIWEYPHNSQPRSVTGGYVYRGPGVPSLTGHYIYADYISGQIWALTYNGSTASNTLLIDTSLNIASFGVDADGELYICAFNGTIYRFTPFVPDFAITLKKLIRTANGTKKVKVKWTSSDVSTNKLDFYVDQVPNNDFLKRTKNDGSFKLKLRTAQFPTDGPFTVQACEKNSTTVCSNVLTADFTGVPIDLTEPEDDLDDDLGDDDVWTRDAEVQPGVVTVEVYPNPFNPTTTIRFGLAEAATVRLAVYDLLGRRVALLANERRAAGAHEVVFDAGTLPSGIYLYRLEVGATVSLGRMTLFR